MRALPIIERVLFAALALVILALLTFLLLWHLHVRAAAAAIATIAPLPGVTQPAPMDPALAADVRAWDEPFIHGHGINGDISYDAIVVHREVQAWLHDPALPRPPVVAAKVDRDDPALAPMTPLLARGMRGPITALCEAAARDLLRARLAPDATAAAPTLHDLDTIAAACATPTFDDAESLTGWIDGLRDEAYLATALDGTLLDEDRRRWSSEHPDLRLRLLVALDGERRFHLPDQVRAQVAESPIAYWRNTNAFLGPEFGELPGDFATWWALPDHFANDIADLDAAAARVAHDSWNPAPDRRDCLAWPMRLASNLAIHRMTVLAVDLLAIHRRTGAFPPDAAAAGPDTPLDLAPGPDRAALVYTRRDGDHCAIHLDPTAPNAFATWIQSRPHLTTFVPDPTAPGRIDALGLDLDLSASASAPAPAPIPADAIR